MDQPDLEPKLNHGEWVEAVAKCHYLLHGYYREHSTGSLYKPAGMYEGVDILRPLSNVSSEYERLFSEGKLIVSTGKGAAFENPPLYDLCRKLKIKRLKADSSVKEDVIFVTASGEKEAYHVENTSAARSSLANGGNTTRITFIILKNGSNPPSADRAALLGRYGKDANVRVHGTKRKFQEIVSTGFELRYLRMNNDGFIRNTKKIGGFLPDVFLFFLLTKGKAGLKAVLPAYAEHLKRLGKFDESDFDSDKEAVLRYIFDQIFYTSPSKLKNRKKEEYPNSGMIFFIKDDGDNIVMVRASGVNWWQNQIYEVAAFDCSTSSRKTKDGDIKMIHGFVYEDGESLLIDAALGFRGAFRDLLRKRKK